jgi:formate dehydrogenase
MMLKSVAEPGQDALSFERLVTEYENGLALRDSLPVGTLLPRLRTADGKIPLMPTEILTEIENLRAERFDDTFPFRVIGMRENQSQNSWMHNVERMMPEGRRFGARVNPATAAALGLSDGDQAVITSPTGTIAVEVILTDDVGPATIAIPHGWGHHGAWQRANRSAGVNSNILASGRAEDLERLAGMSVLNGIPARLEPAGPVEHDAGPAPT